MLAHRCVCTCEFHRWLRKLLLHCTHHTCKARHLHFLSPCWQSSPKVAAFRQLDVAFAHALMWRSELPTDMFDDDVKSLMQNSFISLVVVFLMTVSRCHSGLSDLMHHLKSVLANSAPWQGHVHWLYCFILKSNSSPFWSLALPLCVTCLISLPDSWLVPSVPRYHYVYI